jgi:hypothetical protein
VRFTDLVSADGPARLEVDEVATDVHRVQPSNPVVGEPERGDPAATKNVIVGAGAMSGPLESERPADARCRRRGKDTLNVHLVEDGADGGQDAGHVTGPVIVSDRTVEDDGLGEHLSDAMGALVGIGRDQWQEDR